MILSISARGRFIPDKISINVQTTNTLCKFANGLWSTNATWTNGAIQDVPYSLSIVICTLCLGRGQPV
jgi:hypothetical protein